MDQSIFSQLERLELMAFFSGYPLVYAIIFTIAGKAESRTKLRKRLIAVLPFAYALVGTLYLGLQIRNAHPDYNFRQLFTGLYYPYLKIWGLLAVIFWIPSLSRKPIFSLLHSLPFFYLLLHVLVVSLFTPLQHKLSIRNDMKIYTDSILLTIVSVVVLLGLSSIIIYFRQGRRRNIG